MMGQKEVFHLEKKLERENMGTLIYLDQDNTIPLKIKEKLYLLEFDIH